MLKKLFLYLIIFTCITNIVYAQKPDALRTPSGNEIAIKQLRNQLGDRDKIITLTLKDADIKQALRMLADKIKVNIIFESAIEDIITLDLANVRVSEALEQISMINKLDFALKKGTLMVTYADEPVDIPFKEQPVVKYDFTPDLNEVKTIKVNYANAFYISDFLNDSLLKQGALHKSIAVAQGLNEIVLVANKDTIKKAQEVIKKIDVRPQAYVVNLNYVEPEKMARMISHVVFNNECNVAQSGDLVDNVYPYTITYDASQNSITATGITNQQFDLMKNYVKNFDMKTSQAILDVLMVELNPSGVMRLNELNNIDLAQGKDGIKYGVGCEDSDILGNISYIVNNGGGKMLARPKVTVANNGCYEVNLGSDYVESKQGKHIYNVAKDCGVNLKIHSRINSKNEIILDLEPAYQSVKRVIPSENRPRATLLNRKSFKVDNIRLNDCETLVLGGIVSEKEFRTTPVLKWFGAGKIKNVKSEFMIFVKVNTLD